MKSIPYVCALVALIPAFTAAGCAARQSTEVSPSLPPAAACDEPPAPLSNSLSLRHDENTSSPLPPGEPDKKKILSLLFENMDVPLSVDPSCNGVGTAFQDATIGQYLSGFWAHHTDKDGSNYLKIEIAPKERANNTVAGWEARILIHRFHPEAEEIWAWGVSFEIRGSDHTVMRETFRCLGAG
jgi:hypothetical protein